MTRTRQTKGSTSSKSSPCCPFFAPSATKMRETRNKMPAASVYLLEKTHFLQFFCCGFGAGTLKWQRMGIIKKCFQHLFRAVLCLLLANSIHAADLRHGMAVSINGHPVASFDSHTDELFPLMSVVKFPLSIVVLHRVDKGELSLDMEYHLDAHDLDPHTWSPMQKRYPNGGVFSLAELLRLCLCESDNNACNYLFTLVGGPESVQQFFVKRYGTDFAFRVACTEADMKKIEAKSVNQASPSAVRQILEDVYVAATSPPKNPILSQPQAIFLIKTMNQCSTGQNRLKAGFSETSVAFAHKTGSSGIINGRTLAHNDIGIIQMSGGNYACIVSFISDSGLNEAQMNECHSKLGSHVYNALIASP
jgi:beta-lactamase class A